MIPNCYRPVLGHKYIVFAAHPVYTVKSSTLRFDSTAARQFKLPKKIRIVGVNFQFYSTDAPRLSASAKRETRIVRQFIVE